MHAILELTSTMPNRRNSSGMPLSPDFKSVAEMPESERTLIRTYIARIQTGEPVSSYQLLSHSDRQSLSCGGFPLQFKVARLAKLRGLASDAEVRDALGKKLACLTSPAPQLEARRVPGGRSLESIHARHEAVVDGVLKRAGRLPRRDAAGQVGEPDTEPDSQGAPHPLPESPGAPDPLPDTAGAPHLMPEIPGLPNPVPDSPGAPHHMLESPGTPKPVPESSGTPNPMPGSPGTPRHTSDPGDGWGDGAFTSQASPMHAPVDATPVHPRGEEQVTAEVTPPPAPKAAVSLKRRRAKRLQPRVGEGTYLGNDDRVIIVL